MNLKTLFLTFSALPMLGFGLPSGAIVEKGNASFHNPKSSHLEVSSSGANVINWDTFSIDEHETLKFIQSKGDAVLNRVTGHESGLQMSRIMGTLASEGSVYIVNPEGVLIGSNALIDVASFAATTLDISSEDFINLQKGKNQKGSLKSLVLSGDSKAKVLNLGTIKASSGDVHMIAYQVGNAGNIEAKNGAATLSAGNEAVLQPTAKRKVLIRTKLPSQEGSDKLDEGVKNSGVIEALEVDLGADGNLYKLAINHSGHIEAKTLSKEGGKIYLTSKKGAIEVDGSIVAKRSIGNKEIGGDVRILSEKIALEKNTKIDVSGKHGGGIALVGSDTRGVGTPFNAEHTTVVKGAFVNASALENGNGGKVVFWGQDLVNYYGTTLAEGGTEGGDGGFVEVSSLGKGFNKFIHTGFVSTLAPKGNKGTLLWDPIALLIKAGSGTDENVTESGGRYTFSGSNVAAEIYAANLKSVLLNNNVEIDVGEGGTVRFTKDTLDDTPMDLGPFEVTPLTIRASGSGAGVYFDQAVSGTYLQLAITAPKVVIGSKAQSNAMPMSTNSITVSLNQNHGSFEMYSGSGKATTLTINGSLTVQEVAGVHGGSFIMEGNGSNCEIELDFVRNLVISTSGNVLMTQNGNSSITSLRHSEASYLGGTMKVGTSSNPVQDITLKALGEDSQVFIGESNNDERADTLSLKINTTGDLKLSSSSGSDSFVSIGTYGEPLDIDVGGDVSLTSGGGKVQINSQVGGVLTPGPANINIGGELKIINTSDDGNPLFNIGQSASGAFNVGGIDIEMHEAPTESLLISVKNTGSNNVAVTSSGSISFIGDSSEYIQLEGSNSATLRVTGSESDITLKKGYLYSTSNAFNVISSRDVTLDVDANITSSGTLLVEAGRIVALEDASSNLVGTNLTVVTDQAYPTSPNVGRGHLAVVSGASLSTWSSGAIRVFSGYQENNHSMINDNALFNERVYSSIKGTLDTPDRNNKFGFYYNTSGANPAYSAPTTFYFKAFSPQDTLDEGGYLGTQQIASTAYSSIRISRASMATTFDWMQDERKVKEPVEENNAPEPVEKPVEETQVESSEQEEKEPQTEDKEDSEEQL